MKECVREGMEIGIHISEKVSQSGLLLALSWFQLLSEICEKGTPAKHACMPAHWLSSSGVQTVHVGMVVTVNGNCSEHILTLIPHNLTQI